MSVLTIHSSWHSGQPTAFAGGWRDTYFVDEHPKRTQWSRHTTAGQPAISYAGVKSGTYMIYESWLTMPKGLLLSKWVFILEDGREIDG